MGMQRRNFLSECKQEAVALVRRSGQSANQVAKELGVSQTALSRWLREATRSTQGRTDSEPQKNSSRSAARWNACGGSRHPKKGGWEFNRSMQH